MLRGPVRRTRCGRDVRRGASAPPSRDNPLEPEWTPSDPGVDLATALEREPGDAAAAVWHAPADYVGTIRTLLATRAAVHHDAHLVKYTLACLDAADWDRERARLYLSAAASLHGWWTQADAATREAASASASPTT